MDDLQILIALNNYLSVKSAARLRCVSKTTEKYITPKKYSFYSIFKKIDLSSDNIIKMLFESDKVFIEYQKNEELYLPIKYHRFSNTILKYVLSVNYYYYCLLLFSEYLIESNDNNLDIEEMAKIHCEEYTDYKPLLGILIECCVDTNITLY